MHTRSSCKQKRLYHPTQYRHTYNVQQDPAANKSGYIIQHRIATHAVFSTRSTAANKSGYIIQHRIATHAVFKKRYTAANNRLYSDTPHTISAKAATCCHYLRKLPQPFFAPTTTMPFAAPIMNSILCANSLALVWSSLISPVTKIWPQMCLRPPPPARNKHLKTTKNISKDLLFKNWASELVVIKSKYKEIPQLHAIIKSNTKNVF